MDYYKILEVKKDATQAQIKSSYKKLVKKYHPDIYKTDKLYAEEKIKQLNEAYEILSNDEKRRKYDISNNINPNVKTTNSNQNTKREKTTFEPRELNYKTRLVDFLKKIIEGDIETQNIIVLVIVIVLILVLLGMFFSSSYLSAIVLLALAFVGYNMYSQQIANDKYKSKYIIFNSFEYEKPETYFRLFILRNEQCWITTSQRKIQGDFRECHFNILKSPNGGYVLDGTTPTEQIIKVQLSYISNIVGNFTNIKEGNIYRLANGQTWRQIDNLHGQIQLKSPRAFIINIDGIYYMAIDGLNNLLKVTNM